ncbi:MAG: SpoIID/LytB domain-containing protein [Marinilabiliaceae bacterium]|nr:SpoIID/LytB domain-containing protein [Marinilabiliaceae bacterium]
MEQSVKVGILSAPKINFVLQGKFSDIIITGEHFVVLKFGKILWNNNLYDNLSFTPIDNKSSFTIKDVVIGIGFHWERKEDQRFQGSLNFIVDNENIIAINIINTEDYLKSVISSEMSSMASLELLKAHAVISRSWLLAQINKNKQIDSENIFIETETERIRWYDHKEHTIFDICADDHCQRYQGISRSFQNFEQVNRAVEETKGEVLIFENQICDTRYSKCCGGISEEFQYCWSNTKKPYLKSIRDIVINNQNNCDTFPDLTKENEAIKWIKDCPEAFCNTNKKSVLSQVLNNYDQETIDFYRWKVTFSRKELSQLISQRSGIDFGTIIDLIPMERGVSGRISKLKIIGTKKSILIGKELEIRKILSKSHLYSSAFYVEIKDDIFTLYGAGWGHGVGLCQIGAAVMGNKGYKYKEILRHYYSDAEIAINE